MNETKDSEPNGMSIAKDASARLSQFFASSDGDLDGDIVTSSTQNGLSLDEGMVIDLFRDLQGSIRSNDASLEKIEEVLHHFQDNLQRVSTEIQTIQSRSISLSHRLDNRKVMCLLMHSKLEFLHF